MTMDLKVKERLRALVQNTAPKVARAMAGPGGAIAEGVVRQLGQEILGRNDAPAEEVVSRLEKMTPEDREALIRVETELAQVAAADRADARDWQAKTGDKTPERLAYASFAALLIVFGSLILLQPDGSVKDVVNMIVGALIVIVKQAFDFFLGSSAGSKDKTAILARGGR